MDEKTVTYRDVTVEQLWSIIGGGTNFTLDEVLGQLHESLGLGEAYFIQHHNELFRVGKPAIAAYFETHAAPERRLTVEQQNKVLLDKIKNMETELAILRAGSGGPKPEAEPEEEVAPIDLGDSVDLPDPADIRPSDSGPVMNPEKVTAGEDFRRDLAKGLANVRPAVKNRP